MILEHEIPEGSRLYFGLSAQLKRKIENLSADLFYKHGFKEIVSPTFVYQQHQKSFRSREVIHLSNEKNHAIALRNDSTIDAIRIITKRLGRTTAHKKWFYIQPVFSYPTIEHNQIGVECLNEEEASSILELGINIFTSLDIEPLLQITNTKIPKLCAKETGIDYEFFTKFNVEKLQKVGFIMDLLRINSVDDLRNFLKVSPAFLKEDLEYLLSSCSHNYKNLICSPILPAPVDYYEDIFFKAFINSSTFLSGGRYCIDGVKSCGFGIYTDNIVNYLLNQQSN